MTAAEVDQFMLDNGIDESMAATEIEAHGKRYTVAAAIAECPPFALQIRSTVEALEEAVADPELRATIAKAALTKTIDKMALQSQSVEVTEDFLEPTRMTQA